MSRLLLLFLFFFVILNSTESYGKGTRAYLKKDEDWLAYCKNKIEHPKSEKIKKNKRFYEALLSSFQIHNEYLPDITHKNELFGEIRENTKIAFAFFKEQTVAKVLAEIRNTTDITHIDHALFLATHYRHYTHSERGLSWRMFEEIIKNASATNTQKAKAHLGKTKIYRDLYLKKKAKKEVKKGLGYKFPVLHTWLADHYIEEGNIKKALTSYKASVVTFHEYKKERYLRYNNYDNKLFHSYKQLLKFDIENKKLYLNLALEDIKRVIDPKSQANFYIDIGNTLKTEIADELEKKIECYTKAWRTAKYINDLSLEEKALISLLKIQKEEYYYIQLVDLAEKSNNKDLEAEAYLCLAEMARIDEKYLKAISYYKIIAKHFFPKPTDFFHQYACKMANKMINEINCILKPSEKREALHKRSKSF